MSSNGSLAGDVVLDSSAVIAFFLKEPAAPQVRRLFERALRGKIRLWLAEFNLAEVLWKVVRRHKLDLLSFYQHDIGELPLNLARPTREDTLKAASIKVEPGGLSLADCYAVVLAKKLEATLVVVADPEFKRVAKLVKVKWLG